MIYWSSLSKPYIICPTPCLICKRDVDEIIILCTKTEAEQDFLEKMFSQIHGVSLCYECKDKFEAECKKHGIGFKKLETDKERLDLLSGARRYAHESLSSLKDGDLDSDLR